MDKDDDRFGWAVRFAGPYVRVGNRRYQPGHIIGFGSSLGQAIEIKWEWEAKARAELPRVNPHAYVTRGGQRVWG